MCLYTLNNDYTIWSVWSQFVCGHDLVLSRITRLSIDDLDGDDAIGVGDGELGWVKLLSSLQPFDLKIKESKKWVLLGFEANLKEIFL